MNKKGFTLIELLAIIVVLAVIALIAVPIILGVIDKAKKGAAESSALMYIDAVEKYMVISQINDTKVKLVPGTYQVSDETELSLIDYVIPKVYAEEEKEIYLNDIISIKGDKPDRGWLKIDNNKVEDYSIATSGYIVTKGKETVKGDTPDEVGGSTPVLSGPTKIMSTDDETYFAILYMDPTDLTKTCNAENFSSETGKKEGCMKWYAYKDNNDGTYQWILDHNTTPLVRWSTTNYNNTKADAVKNKLISDIVNWDNYLKINNARIIGADEVASITQNPTFDINKTTDGNGFFLDSNSKTQIATTHSSSKYSWLYNYLVHCTGWTTEYGCDIPDDTLYKYDGVNSSSLYGYWTSTPVYGNVLTAWNVSWSGAVGSNTVTIAKNYGIRPVITY